MRGRIGTQCIGNSRGQQLKRRTPCVIKALDILKVHRLKIAKVDKLMLDVCRYSVHWQNNLSSKQIKMIYALWWKLGNEGKMKGIRDPVVPVSLK